MTIQSDKEAFHTALVLAITAPAKEKAEECLQMAEVFAADLSTNEIEACKKLAELLANPYAFTNESTVGSR